MEQIYEQTDTAKGRQNLVELLCLTRGIDEEEAYDILDEVRYQIADLESGDSYYGSIDDILQDFLGISYEYAWLFR